MPVNYYPSQDSSIQCTPPRRDNFFRVQAVADPKPADNRGGGGWSSGSLPWIHHCQVNKRVGIYIRNMRERVRKYLI